MEHSDDNKSAGSKADDSALPADQPAKQRQRGSRGGQKRKPASQRSDDTAEPNGKNDVETPDRIREGKPSAEAGERGLVRKPKIGDTMPAQSNPSAGSSAKQSDHGEGEGEGDKKKRNRRSKGGGVGNGANGGNGSQSQRRGSKQTDGNDGDKSNGRPSDKQSDRQAKNQKNRRGRVKGRGKGDTQQMDEAWLEQRRGRERNGKPIGRFFMCVQSRPGLAQVAVLEGRNLIEHYVSRPSDDVAQIHGNVYIGKVQNVLPGMEAAFVDIATPKNAVLYRSDVQYEPEDIEVKGSNPRIEDILKNKQLILCQVTKNPIAHKGARLTQEVSLPGRFVVLIPNSKTYGISKRLPDDVRKRLRGILDRVKPDEHGLIVRTAAESATEEELIADMTILLKEWEVIERKAAKAQRPALLYREPELAVRVIREEFNADYRGVLIDDERLWQDVRDYVAAFNPDLADRVEYYDADKEGLSLFERHHVHEQVHKALDRKVWLPSGGSLIIEGTEALTVVDVNTGKNVGKSNLEETVFHNNMEAAVEVAKQLRLRDIGGIIVIDFVDMEIRENRGKVVEALRDALARDKTRSQVFDVSELGLVEMTRKRIGEGLLTEYSEICPDCGGRGVVVDYSMLE
jgi:ribonuclease E